MRIHLQGRSLVLLIGLLMTMALPTAAVGQSQPASVRGTVSEGADGIVRLRGAHDSDGLNLRRDGSRAVPFVAAETGLEASPAVASDGFDWSDAAIGAGVALVAAAAAAVTAVRRRPAVLQRHRPRAAAG
jgi:hypothetical protein